MLASQRLVGRGRRHSQEIAWRPDELNGEAPREPFLPEPRACENARALLIAPDARMAGELAPLLAAQAPPLAVHTVREYPSRAAMREGGADFQLCFLDVTTDPAAAGAALALLGTFCPGMPVIALLRANDPDRILHCLRQGAVEFLIQPFTADQLHSALGKLSRLQPAVRAPEAGHGGRVYCLMPAKGACGASTLAANLAYALKRLGSKKCLLADLDGLTGTVSFLLKLKSNYSFVDALTHAASLDADLWKALVTAAGGVDVLLPPENPVDTIEEAGDPTALLAYMRAAYDTITVDAGGVFGDWNLALARLADELLLVTTNELSALNASQRAMVYLEENGVDRSRIRLVVNRYHKDIGVQAPDIEAALRAQVFQTLPSDYEAVQRALMEGKAAPPGSRLGKSVTALAQRLCGEQAPSGRSSVFGGLLSRLALW